MSDINPGSVSDSLATLLHLARRAREAEDLAQLGFIAVNETHALVPYHQAALWLEHQGVKSLSGVVAPEANAPYVLWLNLIFKHCVSLAPEPVAALDATLLPEKLAEEWAEWLPAHGLILTLKDAGYLLLAREEEWSQAEIALLTEWAGLWSQAWTVLQSRGGFGRILRSRPAPFKLSWTIAKWLALGFIALALSTPVPLTVLAPAELVPVNPAVIRAPLDGVVDRVLVSPNQQVNRNDPLFEFDRAGIQNKLQVAQRALGTLQAEYRQKAQQALFDPASKSQLAPLQGQIAEKSTEIHYLRQLNERGMAVSPRDGIALLDDPTEWTGRPVVTGEKIMMVADPLAVEIEAWLALSDAISLQDGAAVKLYLNADPLQPVVAKLRYVSHEATERADGSYAYRLRATLVTKNPPRLGLKGAAKIQGEQVSIAYWMVRRPLAALRAWLAI